MEFRSFYNPGKFNDDTFFTDEYIVDCTGYMTIQEIIQRYMAGEYIQGINSTTVEYDYNGEELDINAELEKEEFSGDYSEQIYLRERIENAKSSISETKSSNDSNSTPNAVKNQNTANPDVKEDGVETSTPETKGSASPR